MILPYLSMAIGFAAAGGFLGGLAAKPRGAAVAAGAVLGLASFGLFLIAARPVFVAG